jgi:hypothetical protein
MRTRILIAFLLLASSAQFFEAQDSSNVCTFGDLSGRMCLAGMSSELYLKALLVHKPESLPLADKVKFTEDGVEKKLGEGLWKTITRIRGTPPPQMFIDVRQGVAVTFAVVEENAVPALMVARLKIVASKITEAETMITRGQKEGMIFDVDSVNSYVGMKRVPLKSELDSREDLIRIAEQYPQGLKAGSFVTVDVPFAPDA